MTDKSTEQLIYDTQFDCINISNLVNINDIANSILQLISYTDIDSLTDTIRLIDYLNLTEFKYAYLATDSNNSLSETKENETNLISKIIELDNTTLKLKDKLIMFLQYLKEHYPELLNIYAAILTIVTFHIPKSEIIINYNIYINNSTQVIREVEKIIYREDLLPVMLHQIYRIVSTDNLQVRISNSSKSLVVGKLNIGDIVRVIKRHKKWSKIEYYDDNDYTITGYVYNKYLHEIELPRGIYLYKNEEIIKNE